MYLLMMVLLHHLKVLHGEVVRQAHGGSVITCACLVAGTAGDRNDGVVYGVVETCCGTIEACCGVMSVCCFGVVDTCRSTIVDICCSMGETCGIMGGIWAVHCGVTEAACHGTGVMEPGDVRGCSGVERRLSSIWTQKIRHGVTQSALQGQGKSLLYLS